MDIHAAIPLKNFTTFKLGGPAKAFAEVHTTDDVAQAYQYAKTNQLPFFVLGGGSNVVAHDEGYQGLIIHVRIPGFEVVADDSFSTTIKIGAGEIWDSVVQRAVQMRLQGIEAMSGIPGTTGAGPVQNVGAYGQEIADTMQSLEAYDTQTETFVTLTTEQCGFSYRNSIFRSDSAGRYIITSVNLKLSKSSPQPPFYDSLQKYLDDHKITLYTLEIIRNAVLDIRANKLPDPKLMPNAGSFFKNSIVEDWQLTDIRTQYPDIPLFEMGDGRYKVPTGWLIEQAGFKGKLLHGIRVNDKNALVLINESATGYHDLALARDEIIGGARDAFHIQIEQEPLEIS